MPKCSHHADLGSGKEYARGSRSTNTAKPARRRRSGDDRRICLPQEVPDEDPLGRPGRLESSAETRRAVQHSWTEPLAVIVSQSAPAGLSDTHLADQQQPEFIGYHRLPVRRVRESFDASRVRGEPNMGQLRHAMPASADHERVHRFDAGADVLSRSAIIHGDANICSVLFAERVSGSDRVLLRSSLRSRPSIFRDGVSLAESGTLLLRHGVTWNYVEWPANMNTPELAVIVRSSAQMPGARPKVMPMAEITRGILG